MKQIFFTGLIIQPDEPGQPSPPFYGKGWDVTFIEERRNPPLIRDGREIVINATTWRTAQHALNLIISALLLIKGGFPVSSSELVFVAHNENEPPISPNYGSDWFKSQSLNTLSIPLACSLAGKASKKLKWVYAVSKYKFSVSLYRVHAMDMEPHYSEHMSVSPFADDHIMFSHAIVSAYSAIEDLGLEIRASHKKPSRINGRMEPRGQNGSRKST